MSKRSGTGDNTLICSIGEVEYLLFTQVKLNVIHKMAAPKTFVKFTGKHLQ